MERMASNFNHQPSLSARLDQAECDSLYSSHPSNHYQIPFQSNTPIVLSYLDNVTTVYTPVAFDELLFTPRCFLRSISSDN